MQENYLAKWLNNELSEEELTTFQSTEAYASYQKLLEVSNSLTPPAFDVESALTALNERKDKKTQRAKVIPLFTIKRLMRIAAALAILLVGSFMYFNSLDENVSTKYAERKEIILPDDSRLTLNADSKISYNEKAWNKKRNISLDGEAFFKVAKGKRFTVTTRDGLVAVLGTHFNVENRDGFFEVTCYEGLVSVTYNAKETKLPAGTSFMVVNGVVQENDLPQVANPSWIDNESSFKSIPLQFVFAELERQFNISIEIHGVDLNQLFTGTFSNTNVNLALQSISVPSHLQYELEGNKVLFYAQSAP